MSRKWLVTFILGIILCVYAQEANCSIALKSVVVNPSRTKTQKATLKAYLPKEAKPEDILDLGDLKIDYDLEKGLYFVYKQFELKPGEGELRKVEIKDIWIIAESELTALSNKAKEIVEKLKDSEFFEDAVALMKQIEEKQADIIKTQNDALDTIPQEHIAVYRLNVDKMDEIKANIAKLEKMFLEYNLAKGRAGKVSVKASWFVILSVIIALGVISFAFFFIWHQQAGVLKGSRKKLKGDEESPEEDKAV